MRKRECIEKKEIELRVEESLHQVRNLQGLRKRVEKWEMSAWGLVPSLTYHFKIFPSNFSLQSPLKISFTFLKS